MKSYELHLRRKVVSIEGYLIITGIGDWTTACVRFLNIFFLFIYFSTVRVRMIRRKSAMHLCVAGTGFFFFLVL